MFILEIHFISKTAAQCSYIMKQAAGSIRFPETFNSYSSDLNCRWLIEVPVENNVFLTVSPSN